MTSISFLFFRKKEIDELVMQMITENENEEEEEKDEQSLSSRKAEIKEEKNERTTSAGSDDDIDKEEEENGADESEEEELEEVNFELFSHSIQGPTQLKRFTCQSGRHNLNLTNQMISNLPAKCNGVLYNH